MSHSSHRMLLIVDPQIDFITGTLPVPCAEKAMDSLADYLLNHGNEYALICVTCDRHPLRHSSFKDFGGIWSKHCIEASVGASIWPPIMEALQEYSHKTHILYKGEDIAKEEYSIFQSSKGAAEIQALIDKENITELDICGLAGDVCVADTLKDATLIYPDIRFHLLDKYTAYLQSAK